MQRFGGLGCGRDAIGTGSWLIPLVDESLRCLEARRMLLFLSPFGEGVAHRQFAAVFSFRCSLSLIGPVCALSCTFPVFLDFAYVRFCLVCFRCVASLFVFSMINRRARGVLVPLLARLIPRRADGSELRASRRRAGGRGTSGARIRADRHGALIQTLPGASGREASEAAPVASTSDWSVVDVLMRHKN